MKVVLLGAGGMLARDILSQTPIDYEVVPFTRTDLDVRDTSALERALNGIRPSWIINASGYTDVDEAERDASTAYAVNSAAVGEAAKLCAANDTALLHYSTDYVFDGTKEDFYSEDDVPRPLSVYGASKLEGEERVVRSGAHHLIIRSQWLFGGTGKSFVSTICERAHQALPTKAVDDQFGCCTYTVDLARASWDMLRAGHTGTFHIANRGRVSRYVLASCVFRALDVAQCLSACSSAEFPARARRPRNSPLGVEKAERALGYRMPPWTDALQRYLHASEGSFARTDQR